MGRLPSQYRAALPSVISAVHTSAFLAQLPRSRAPRSERVRGENRQRWCGAPAGCGVLSPSGARAGPPMPPEGGSGAPHVPPPGRGVCLVLRLPLQRGTAGDALGWLQSPRMGEAGPPGSPGLEFSEI